MVKCSPVSLVRRMFTRQTLSRKYCARERRAETRQIQLGTTQLTSVLTFFVSAQYCFHLPATLFHSVTMRFIAHVSRRAVNHFYQFKWLKRQFQCHHICNHFTCLLAEASILKKASKNSVEK